MANNSFLSSIDFRRPFEEWFPQEVEVLRSSLGHLSWESSCPHRVGGLWSPQMPGQTFRHKVWALLRAKSFLGRRQTTLEGKLLGAAFMCFASSGELFRPFRKKGRDRSSMWWEMMDMAGVNSFSPPAMICPSRSQLYSVTPFSELEICCFCLIV